MTIWAYGFYIGVLAFVAVRNHFKVIALQRRIDKLEKQQSVNKAITGAMIINDFRLHKLEMKTNGG
jgi:hypothetical protein